MDLEVPVESKRHFGVPGYGGGEVVPVQRDRMGGWLEVGIQGSPMRVEGTGVVRVSMGTLPETVEEGGVSGGQCRWGDMVVSRPTGPPGVQDRDESDPGVPVVPR